MGGGETGLNTNESEAFLKNDRDMDENEQDCLQTEEDRDDKLIKELKPEDDDEITDETTNRYFTLTNFQLPTINFRSKEFRPNFVTYLMYLIAPMYVAMVVLGFLYKDKCPIDRGVPRYLFLGGLAGLMVTLLKIILVISWKKAVKGTDASQFDPMQHPGLNMVRVVMYIFFVFMMLWNVYAVSHVLGIDPDLDDQNSPQYCHPYAYYPSLVLVLLFASIAGSLLALWIAAIVLGLCNPDFLVRFGYFTSADEIHFGLKKKPKRELPRVRDVLPRPSSLPDISRYEDGLNEKENLKLLQLEKKLMKKRIQEIQKEEEKRIKEEEKRIKALGKLHKNSLLLNGNKTTREDEDKKDEAQVRTFPLNYSPSLDEEKAALGIVRFANEVNARRISVDYNRKNSLLDIKNFPKGPFKINESES